MNIKFSTLFTITFFWTLISVQANETNIKFCRLNTIDGLPSNEVSCIFRDQKGFMWFGTENILTRYDGFEFNSWRHNIDQSPFSSEYIDKLFETADGRIWITYQNGAISIFDPVSKQFATMKAYGDALKIPQPTRVFSFPGGQLLYATDIGLYSYNYADQKTTRYPISLDEGEICATFVREDLLYAIHSSGLIDIINIRKNQLVGTINNFMTTADNIHSLNLFVDSTSSQTVPVRIQFNHSLNLFVDSTGECWVYMNPQTYSGLFRYSPTNKRWTHYTTTSTPLLSSNLVRGIIENTDGNIWIATDHGGINVLDKRQNTIRYLKNDPYDPQSLSQNSIISIYRDTSDIIWCGTYKNGINYYHESIFKFNTLKYPLHNTYDTSINDYNCVIEDAEGNLWIGTNGSGLIHYNRKNNQFRQYKHDDKDPNSLSSDIIICLQRDANGHLWIGTYLGGLNRFDGKQFKQYKPADQTLSNSIYSMYVDEDNHLWVGTLDNGLYCMDLKNNEWQTIETDNLTSFVMQETVYAISRGIHANELFIGTSAGISTINRWTRHISPFNPSGRTVSLSGNKSINTILTDSRNLVWIGTNSGIVIHDSVHNKEYNLTIRNGLPSNSIMSIIEDLSHTIWIGSKNGLLKIVPTYHDDTDRYSFDVSTHYENEGVQDRVFNRNCVSYTSKGEILMGGINGLTVFNPLRLLYNDIPSTPIITTLLIHNRHKDQSGEFESERLDVSYEEHVDLTYNERSITIGMAAFTYILPETTTFQFYLQGFDKDWETIQSRNGRYITYTNLPAGKYTFFVKAYDANATHNQSVASLGITIHPPFWYTNWAIVIYILILMLVAYVIIHSLTSIQQRKLAHKYVELQTMHTHEMDETRLQFFTNISHELRTPLTLIMAPLDQLIKEENNPIHKNLLNVIHNNAERLLMLVNQLLDFRKINTGNALLLLSSGDIVSFVRNIVYSFKNVAEKRHLKLLFSCHFSSLLIGFDTDKVFKIISNLINNAIKFTPDNGQIAITISLERRENDSYWIVIDVTDTGIGIESNQAELIFQRFYQVQTPPDQLTPVGTGIGLHISRELAQLHGGTLTLTKSEPGVGSTFTFAFPTQLYNINEVVTTDKEEATSVQAETSIGPFNAPLVLVADDNAEFCHFMQQSLLNQYRIITANNGNDAWKIVQEKKIDLVISDVMMPGIDGIELCKKIKSDKAYAHIPVIIITAKVTLEDKRIGLEAGVDDYIEKPFSIELLRLKMQQLIAIKEKMLQKGIPLTATEITSMDEKLIQRSIAFIEQHIDKQDLSVEALAQEVGMSRTNYYKRVLAVTGKTPSELIRSVRLQHASMLISKGQLRVSEVALMVGYNDIRLFRKYFHEEFGVYPSAMKPEKEIYKPKK